MFYDRVLGHVDTNILSMSHILFTIGFEISKSFFKMDAIQSRFQFFVNNTMLTVASFVSYSFISIIIASGQFGLFTVDLWIVGSDRKFYEEHHKLFDPDTLTWVVQFHHYQGVNRYEIMSDEQYYLTSDGAQQLRTELEDLKGTAREDISNRLREAIQMGDLSENADYHKAKEDQAFLEGRIQELEYLLQNAVIIEEISGVREVVEIGVNVTIQEAELPPETYKLVGAKEADPRNGRISHESPIGKALIGKRVSEDVLVQTPGGQIRLKILEISWPC